MPDNPEACRDVLEHFGDILAQLAQMTTAVGTGVHLGFVGLYFARQMFGKCLSSWSLRHRFLGEIRCRRELRISAGFGRLQLFQLELELLDLPLQLLRLAPKLHAP